MKMNINAIFIITVALLVTLPTYASDSQTLQIAYKRAEKAFYDNNWREMPDETLIRANRIKWNRLAKAALNLPDWIEFSLSQRTRFEFVSNNWRAGQRNADNTQLPLQSRVRFGINRGPFWVLFEGQDSRTHFDQPGDFAGGVVENKFDILQLFGSATFNNAFNSGLRTDVHFGRMTLELGSARLLGRQVYPNATNAFDGVHLSIGNNKPWRVRSFLTAPVVRANNELDDTANRTLFWGTALESRHHEWLNGEIYYLGLSDERSRRPNSARHLHTTGVRLFKADIRKASDFKAGEHGAWDYDFEGATQVGDQRGKNHFAWMAFARVGYTLNVPWIPRLAGEYIYASGTRNPDGEQSATFDRLFGLRRPDLGQTSLFGPFGHSNLISTGWRLTLHPTNHFRFFIKHHLNWLAEKRDAFSRSALPGFLSLQDKSGSAGSFLGHDIEVVGHYKIRSNIDFEAGYQRWFKGGFFDGLTLLADRGGLPINGEKDSDYFFVQTTIKF
ncbi:MAG: alginate export family protein [Nitrosomonas sp.]|nr:alginate export family protein [Nitrosomonas sp.]